MYLVAIGWMFVVVMMAAAEAMSPIGTVLGAFFTLAAVRRAAAVDRAVRDGRTDAPACAAGG